MNNDVENLETQSRLFLANRIFVVTAIPGYYQFTNSENAQNIIYIDSDTLPESFGKSNLCVWNKILINWNFCDFFTSFGLPNSPIPTPPDLILALSAIRINGPCCASPNMLTAVQNEGGGVQIKDETTSTTNTAYLRTLATNSGVLSAVLFGAGNTEIDLDTNIEYLTPDTSNPGKFVLTRLDNGDSSALITLSEGPAAVQIYSDNLVQLHSNTGLYQVIDIPEADNDNMIMYNSISGLLSYKNAMDEITAIIQSVGGSIRIAYNVVSTTVGTLSSGDLQSITIPANYIAGNDGQGIRLYSYGTVQNGAANAVTIDLYCNAVLWGSFPIPITGNGGYDFIVTATIDSFQFKYNIIFLTSQGPTSTFGITVTGIDSPDPTFPIVFKTTATVGAASTITNYATKVYLE